MTRILVAFASKHHSTAEIAEAIGEVLRESGGLLVDVRSVETVRDLTGYDAVIVGSAVYAGQWQGEAAAFLKQHERDLAQRPTWLFSSGPTGEGDPKTLLKGWELPEALRPVAERIKPRALAVFHGSLESDRLSVLERLIVKGVKAPLGDFRDWQMIQKWASGIAEALKRAEHV
jgi:menaquinone-dependent protoporphyrinogen oxidase